MPSRARITPPSSHKAPRSHKAPQLAQRGTGAGVARRERSPGRGNGAVRDRSWLRGGGRRPTAASAEQPPEDRVPLVQPGDHAEGRVRAMAAASSLPTGGPSA
jgi:hypothetical protein